MAAPKPYRLAVAVYVAQSLLLSRSGAAAVMRCGQELWV